METIAAVTYIHLTICDNAQSRSLKSARMQMEVKQSHLQVQSIYIDIQKCTMRKVINVQFWAINKLLQVHSQSLSHTIHNLIALFYIHLKIVKTTFA